MHIKHYEYKEIISIALYDYIVKYSLCFDKENEYGIDL